MLNAQHWNYVSSFGSGVFYGVGPMRWLRWTIEDIEADTGKASRRERLLPAAAVVYFVMARALWREAPPEEALRVVCEGLQWLGGGEAGRVQASQSAVSRSRQRRHQRISRHRCFASEPYCA